MGPPQYRGSSIILKCTTLTSNDRDGCRVIPLYYRPVARDYFGIFENFPPGAFLYNPRGRHARALGSLQHSGCRESPDFCKQKSRILDFDKSKSGGLRYHASSPPTDRKST